MNNYSYILKVKHKDKYYICNRNSTWFNNHIKASDIVNFWGIEYESVFQISEDYQIIEILPYSNTKCKDQKIINERKKAIIAKDPELNEDEKICDSVISSTIKRYKSKMRKYKKEILTSLDKYNPDELVYITKFIKCKAYMNQFYKQERYTFPSFEKWKEKANIHFINPNFAKKIYAFWLLCWGSGIGSYKDQGIQTVINDLSNVFNRSYVYQNFIIQKAIRSFEINRNINRKMVIA